MDEIRKLAKETLESVNTLSLALQRHSEEKEETNCLHWLALRGYIRQVDNMDTVLSVLAEEQEID